MGSTIGTPKRIHVRKVGRTTPCDRQFTGGIATECTLTARRKIGSAGEPGKLADSLGGTYRLTTPQDKSLTLSFSRKSADVIQITLSGPKREFSFDVRQTGFSDS